jgi:hypothetical protein
MRHRNYDEREESQQPRSLGWILWLGVAALALCLLTVCVIGGFFFVQRFENQVEPAAPPLVMPALPTVSADPTESSLAPTVTVGQPAVNVPAPAAASNVDAERFSQPPAVDGELSEWTGRASFTSAYRVYSANSWDGSDDLTAVWHLGWDDDNLYIAVEVTDDTHVQIQTDNQIFRGDSVEIQFDTDRAGDYGPRVSPDDFQIVLSPGDFTRLSPSAFRFRGTINGEMVDAPGHQVAVAARHTGIGYNLEAAVPWDDVEVTPEPAIVMGLALNANDNDTPGTSAQEVMKSHVPGRTLRNPTSWGTITLK